MKQLRDMTKSEMRNYFNALARAIEKILPESDNKRGKCLFVLLMFDDPSLAQYVSNAERKDITKAMREFANRLERKEDIPR